MADVVFHFSLLSPYVYLAGPQVQRMLAAHSATCAYRPVDIMRLLRDGGGTPLAEQPPARRAYRLVERARWAKHLGMPISSRPLHHPTDDGFASALVAVLAAEGWGDALWPVAQELLAAVWVKDEDIADRAVVTRIAERHGVPATVLARAATPAAREIVQSNTRTALENGVFGVPSFQVSGELFFGQDRLGFVAQALRDQKDGADRC